MQVNANKWRRLSPLAQAALLRAGVSLEPSYKAAWRERHQPARLTAAALLWLGALVLVVLWCVL